MMQSSNLRDGVGGRRVKRGRRSFWAYTVIASTFLILEAFASFIPGRVKSIASDVAAPVLSILEQPITAIQQGLERLAGVSDIYVENETLRVENERLKQWREAALQLARENEKYRDILKAPGREVPTAATGRVVGTSGGAFEQSVVIDVGTSHGVKKDLPVVDDGGVVGRIIGTGYFSSRVLLVTDVNSHVPVRLERTGDLAIIEGTNGMPLDVRYLLPTVELQLGDRFLTSGHGGLFPPDLPVAVVSSVAGENVLVNATGALNQLDFLKVLDYQAKMPEEELVDPKDADEPVGEAIEQGGSDGDN